MLIRGALEASIGGEGYCLAPEPGLAEVCLVPQLYAALQMLFKDQV